MEDGMDGQTLYNMYMQVANSSSLREADEWAENSLTDGEIKTLKAYIKEQEKANRRNWSVQDFQYIEFRK
jgi:hypothetical protein